MVAHLVDCHLIYLWGGFIRGIRSSDKKDYSSVEVLFFFERGKLEEPGEKLREPTNSSHEVRRVRNRTQDRRRLQRKGHFKIELSHGLVFLWKEWVKDLLLRVHVVVRTSIVKSSRRCLADYVKKIHQKRAARAARLFPLIQPIIA